MSHFPHHGARVSGLRAAGDDSLDAAKRIGGFVSASRGSAARIPMVLDGEDVLVAARGSAGRLAEHAMVFEPVARLLARAAWLWAEAVDDFNWRVDQLNVAWSRLHPSVWDDIADPVGWAAGQVDRAAREKHVANAVAELNAAYAKLVAALDETAAAIARSLDAGPGAAVDAFYEAANQALARSKSRREAGERARADHDAMSWLERLKSDIGWGVVTSLAGVGDLLVVVSPFSPSSRFNHGNKDHLDWDQMPSAWVRERARESGVDVDGPVFNLSAAAAGGAQFMVPGLGEAEAADESAQVAERVAGAGAEAAEAAEAAEGAAGAGVGSEALAKAAKELGEPGKWGPVNESMSARARAYQERITGRPSTEAYRVTDPDTGNPVKFDSYDHGVLIDAKGPGYDSFVGKNGRFEDWWLKKGGEQMLDQANRQVSAARGIRLEWIVAEPKAAAAIRRLLFDNGIDDITVVARP